MARTHARIKGRSGSKRPVNADLSFVQYSAKDVEKMIVEFGKEDKTPSVIGIILRDTYGIPSVKKLTGKSVTDILKENNLLHEIPEDLASLIKKAENLKKHLVNNKKDLHNRRGLSLIEAKIRRLGKYYKRTGRLPENWKY
jgi:small subunit ribosomal protein S15